MSPADIFKSFPSFPSLLCILLLLPMAARILPEGRLIQRGQRWVGIAVGLTALLAVVLAFANLTVPDYVDNVEPTVVGNAWMWWHGAPLYPAHRRHAGCRGHGASRPALWPAHLPAERHRSAAWRPFDPRLEAAADRDVPGHHRIDLARLPSLRPARAQRAAGDGGDGGRARDQRGAVLGACRYDLDLDRRVLRVAGCAAGAKPVWAGRSCSVRWPARPPR